MLQSVSGFNQIPHTEEYLKGTPLAWRQQGKCSEINKDR